MLGSVRLGADQSMGHGCWPPTKTASGSISSFVNSLPQVRVSDTYVIHCCPGPPGCHVPTVVQGSPTHFCDGLAYHTMTHALSCGDRAATGSTNVFSG